MATDIGVIVGIHQCLRKEFASLPLRVKAVPVGDGDRAAVVGRHVLLMCDLLEAHARAHDEVVRPLVAERAADREEEITAVEDDNRSLTDSLPAVRAQVQAWQNDPTVHNRATIHTTLIGFERLLLAQLGSEETRAVPVLAEVLTSDDVHALLATGLAALPDDEVPLAVGMLLEDAASETGQVLWARLPAQVREEFDRTGRTEYADYRRRLGEG